jgi:hypothetical protein
MKSPVGLFNVFEPCGKHLVDRFLGYQLLTGKSQAGVA